MEISVQPDVVSIQCVLPCKSAPITLPLNLASRIISARQAIATKVFLCAQIIRLDMIKDPWEPIVEVKILFAKLGVV